MLTTDPLQGTPALVDRNGFLPVGWAQNSEGVPAPCIVMFSGGRDSTLAAVRLQRTETRIALVTVTSGHLVGIDRVKSRLRELARVLPPETPWVLVRQPRDLATDTSFYERTCLPCHHAYVVVSAAIAASASARRLAFGYAGYQAHWPEQTPLAVSRLEQVLARHGIRLELPVYNLQTRTAALAELADLGLSSAALEQKCLVQVSNVSLNEARLEQQVELWEHAISASMEALPSISFDVIDRVLVGDTL